MKVKIQIIGVLPIMLTLLAGISAMSAETWMPGVRSGDYFTYEMYGVYTSNRLNETIPIPLFEKNNTDWTRINITAVSGSNIYQTYTLHYKDNSETYFDFQTDVKPQNQGIFRMAERGVPICAANLMPGDLIPTAQIILNDTVKRNYAVGSREINYASWSGADEWGEIFFDKQTGILVELRRTRRFVNSNIGMIVEKTDIIELIDTNKWQIES